LAADGAVSGSTLTGPPPAALRVPICSVQRLGDVAVDVLVVAADETKEDLLLVALPCIVGNPKIIVAGYVHLATREPGYHEELAGRLVPSLANGYPNTLPTCTSAAPTPPDSVCMALSPSSACSKAAPPCSCPASSNALASTDWSSATPEQPIDADW
jgi:hypothetical protein